MIAGLLPSPEVERTDRTTAAGPQNDPPGNSCVPAKSLGCGHVTIAMGFRI